MRGPALLDPVLPMTALAPAPPESPDAEIRTSRSACRPSPSSRAATGRCGDAGRRDRDGGRHDGRRIVLEQRRAGRQRGRYPPRCGARPTTATRRHQGPDALTRAALDVSVGPGADRESRRAIITRERLLRAIGSVLRNPQSPDLKRLEAFKRDSDVALDALGGRAPRGFGRFDTGETRPAQRQAARRLTVRSRPSLVRRRPSLVRRACVRRCGSWRRRSERACAWRTTPACAQRREPRS